MDLDSILPAGIFIVICLLLYILLIVTANVTAWRGKTLAPAVLIISTFAIPALMFGAAEIDNAGHGSGYDGVELATLFFVIPAVFGGAIVFGLTSFGLAVQGRKARAENRQTKMERNL
jgi:hypothetical protein